MISWDSPTRSWRGPIAPSGSRLARTGALGGVNIEQLQQGATRFPGIKIFEQSRNEQLLYATLTGLGGDVLWGHRLVDLVDNTAEPDGRILALLEGAGGLVRVRARWCIGADGASSTVRRDLDVRFDGVTDDATFWVADIHDASGLPDGAVAARFGASTFAMAFPLGPGGHARLIALAPHDSVTQDEALRSAHDDLGMTFGRVDWFSTYRVHHRVASRFRVGSVFLAGDAGHVHSPVGGQGMNTGLQDAHNLALLLADIVQGRRDAGSLDRYERERRPVAERLVKVTDRAFGIIGRRSFAASFLRNRGSGLGTSIMPRIARSRLGARLGGYLGQYRIRYHYLDRKAPVPAWANDPAVGLRLPPADGNHKPLSVNDVADAHLRRRTDHPARRTSLGRWPLRLPRRPPGPPKARPPIPRPARRLRRCIDPPPRPRCRRRTASPGHYRPQANHLSHHCKCGGTGQPGQEPPPQPPPAPAPSTAAMKPSGSTRLTISELTSTLRKTVLSCRGR